MREIKTSANPDEELKIGITIGELIMVQEALRMACPFDLGQRCTEYGPAMSMGSEGAGHRRNEMVNVLDTVLKSYGWESDNPWVY